MSGGKKGLRNARQRSVHIAATVFLLPALIVLSVYVVYPIIDSFINSTMRWKGMGGTKSFTGFDNWVNLIKDVYFWKAFVNNIKIMFLSLLFQVPFAMALATFLDVTDRKGYLFKVVWFIPYLLSSVAIGVLFKFAQLSKPVKVLPGLMLLHRMVLLTKESTMG
jgi:raffinose/stachyose/melibiose transport system permease protein